MAKKTELLTNNNEKFNELLLSIQQETAYKAIKDSLGNEVYNALQTKNFLDLIIAFEKLKYDKNNKTKTKELALGMIEDLIQQYDLKNFKKDLLKFSKKLFTEEAMTKEKFTNFYNRISNKMRNYIVLKFLDEEKIKRKTLKEIWDEVNNWYKNIMFGYEDYIREQEEFQSDCNVGIYG